VDIQAAVMIFLMAINIAFLVIVFLIVLEERKIRMTKQDKIELRLKFLRIAEKLIVIELRCKEECPRLYLGDEYLEMLKKDRERDMKELERLGYNVRNLR
jgi:hypothetical protein